MAQTNISVNKKEYIQLICERLTCSRRDKKKISKSLNREIDESLKKGETIEHIIARMGSPKEISQRMMQGLKEVPPLTLRLKLYRFTSIFVFLGMIYFIISKTVTTIVTSRLSNQVIGYADEPTVIFLSGSISPSSALNIFSCSFALCITFGCGIILYKLQKHYRY